MSETCSFLRLNSQLLDSVAQISFFNQLLVHVDFEKLFENLKVYFSTSLKHVSPIAVTPAILNNTIPFCYFQFCQCIFYLYYFSWAERNHEALSAKNSTIEFNLHKMNFLMLINSKTEHSRWDALQYAKVFQMFSPKHSQGLLHPYSACVYDIISYNKQ